MVQIHAGRPERSTYTMARRAVMMPCSAAGSASAPHAEGHGFDSHRGNHKKRGKPGLQAGVESAAGGADQTLKVCTLKSSSGCLS